MELDWWEKAFSGQHSALSEEKIAEKLKADGSLRGGSIPLQSAVTS
jgi:hypothetical protein